MISFNIETLNSGKNPPLQTSFIKFDIGMANFKSLLNMGISEKRLNKADIKKVG